MDKFMYSSIPTINIFYIRQNSRKLRQKLPTWPWFSYMYGCIQLPGLHLVDCLQCNTYNLYCIILIQKTKLAKQRSTLQARPGQCGAEQEQVTRQDAQAKLKGTSSIASLLLRDCSLYSIKSFNFVVAFIKCQQHEHRRIPACPLASWLPCFWVVASVCQTMRSIALMTLPLPGGRFVLCWTTILTRA